MPDDVGLAMHFHLVGQLAVAFGGVGFHCQCVGQQYAQAVDRLILRASFTHGAISTSSFKGRG
ncbi:MAG: hypothetical protein IPN05_08845 [Sulfuritalea sp.]|nr:hypothetical protein [Sulfuritalea sp.]